MHKCSSCTHQPTNSFSLLFTMPNYDQHVCPYDSSSVDCTLSLATPSSRLTSVDFDSRPPPSSRFCWDFLHPENHSPPAPLTPYKTHRGGPPNADSLLARRCANCDTTSTPLWRNGPRGPKSLCNACGIRYKKEKKRASATTGVVGGGADVAEGYNGNMWMNHTQTAVGGEFRFVDDVDDRDSTFLSWRLNVTDRPGLVHDFTRY
ncbi:GATA transcription factor 19-like [Rutidosis leptorrhynchoides]|uniref:GATA transcription factor 19-like n=1 Tax=Rutidosis leptorrhynchoides TaxID=125765 RepID=UPI003A9A16A0